MRAEFVQRLPECRGGEYLRVRVQELSKDIVDWWHKCVQPTIDQDTSRADAGWAWPFITAFNRWTEPPNLLPEGFALCVNCGTADMSFTSGAGYPVALIQTVSRIPFIEDRRQYSMLLQYLSTIPRQLLPSEAAARLVGVGALDISLVRTLQLGYSGRMMLRIGEKDRSRLARWCTHTCGMVAAEQGGQTVEGCFVHRPDTAMRAYSRLQHLRLGEDPRA